MTDIIKHISDTSFWVAHYRAIESKRSDALFNDPYASILVGDKAAQIEKIRSEATRWTQWTVVMRTCLIDKMIRDLIEKGVTTFLNIGAGLDSRPYRMNLEKDIQWIEVDFPHMQEYKSKLLQEYKPTCQLERVSLDLSNRAQRKNFLEKLASDYAQIAVLTEGVLPYLTQSQVSELSEDLTYHPCFVYWITEYLSPKAYPYLKNPRRMKALKNTPFQFFPDRWMHFFESRGWKVSEAQYYADVSERLKRPTPVPKFFRILEFFLGKRWAQLFKKMSGFILWERS
jgi:methyltransferase (TIGR00027 family)